MNKLIKLAALCLVLGVAACSKKEEATSEAPVTEIKLTAEQKTNAGIEFGALEEREMSTEVKCTGVVDVPPISLASISIPIAGYVKTTYELLPGKKVSKGQALATLTSLDFIQMQQEYLQALSSQTFMSSEKSRQQVLTNEEVGSKKKLQQSEADLGNVNAQVKALGLKLEVLGCDLKSLAKGNLSSVLTLRSPIDGYIQDQFLAIGKYVTPSDVLIKVVGMADKHVELKVFEKDLAKLNIGQTIEFESEGQKANAKIFLIAPQVDLTNRTTSVHGHFANKSDEKNFTVGQFVSARIEVGSQKIPSIPQAGLARVGKGGFIYVEMTNGAMAQVPVEILSSTPDYAGIKLLKELPAGKVVTKGASALEAIFAKD
ncbi:efflux RND transporter periplasmic adaptor subunit [Aquirufa antheringensis]|uniref:efflux RND transporter periplasmic adaptor subunit n=1 Tax=Aquirufa antheringensis TaxID=2516559 RepID=UPI001032CCD3|nr:efflux RND transporter periplasmic adaptor subunit [Aquirufa antheringensis]MCZ2486894.1 efflux RND transporter periplasmic adaptor subunit [Aquirufa antheringensis]TBH71795.1 efflux RND transporter periplasmic adaptor subunit [Aquirufa antheringensis]